MDAVQRPAHNPLTRMLNLKIPTPRSTPSACAAAVLWTGALAAGFAAPAAAQSQVPAPQTSAPSEDDQSEAILYMKDGRRLTGLLISQSAAAISIKIAGIQTTVATEDVERLEVLEPVMSRYKALRDAVGDDPEQIVKLAEWLQSRERYEIALSEVQRALAIDPTHGRALKLQTLLKEQIVLKSKSRKKPAPPADPDADESENAAPRPQPIKSFEFPLLTQEQVALMKVYEVNLKDDPRIVIPRETITQLLERYSTHPLIPITREGREAIYRMQPAEVLDLMFRIQARDLYSSVEVIDQPKAMAAYRDQVQRSWLLNSCATNQCHGGTEAGRLVLYNRRPNADRAIYTNFLILSRFKLADGTPLIDWTNPDRSPLLQMALPRDRSRNPHPEVRKGVSARDTFKPVFRAPEDRGFQNAVEWIHSLYRPRPDYPLDYTPIRPSEPPPPPAKPEPPKPTSGNPSPHPAPAGQPTKPPAAEPVAR